MKKISFIVFALSIGLVTFAQNENVTPMAVNTRFGIKAGVNLAKLRPSDFATNEPQTNLYGKHSCLYHGCCTGSSKDFA